MVHGRHAGWGGQVVVHPIGDDAADQDRVGGDGGDTRDGQGRAAVLRTHAAVAQEGDGAAEIDSRAGIANP